MYKQDTIQPSAPPPQYYPQLGNPQQHQLHQHQLHQHQSHQHQSHHQRQLTKAEKVQQLLSKYDLNPVISEKLGILSNFEIALIIDDSGSMNTPLNDGSGHATRWDELKSVMKIVLDIALTFDDDGIDMYFLNRENVYGVTSYEQIEYTMSIPPSGVTNLKGTSEQLYSDYTNHSKKVLQVICTDGLPTNGFGNPDINGFTECIKKRNCDKFYISILACSDNDKDVGYLEKLDKTVKNVDILDDYISEKKQVLKVQGRKFKYEFNDHIVRLLLGPIIPELDALDEYPLSGCRCSIL